MLPAPNQVGWASAIGELYYELNPISLNKIRTTLLERPLVRMTLYCLGSNNGLTVFISLVVTVRGLTLHDHIIMTLLTSFIRSIKPVGNCQSLPLFGIIK